MRNATPPCLDTFCRLDRLGLSVTAQRVEPDHTVLRCRPTTPPSPCPGCAGPGVRHDAVLRRLAHVPFGWKPTILEVVVPRYRCWPCRRIWRHSITAAAPSKGKLSRDAVMVAVKSIVVDRMSIARVAANLGVAWNTASDAILAAGTELLIDSADRLEGVTTVGAQSLVVPQRHPSAIVGVIERRGQDRTDGRHGRPERLEHVLPGPVGPRPGDVAPPLIAARRQLVSRDGETRLLAHFANRVLPH